MEHHQSLQAIHLQKSWLAIGVFDGVHRGHQQLINAMTAGAHAQGVPAVVVTFDPHPARVFGRGEIKLLTLPAERADLFEGLGVDHVITHPFDLNVADITAFDFMKRLVERLGLKHLVLGYDSTLGRNREGNAMRLAEIGLELGFTVEVVPALSDESGVISSTEIRKLISTGIIDEATHLLGHPYRLRGAVIHGDRRGRELGYPTANLVHAEEKLIPANGIYACWAKLGPERFKAAVNIGVRPTVKSGQQIPNVEAYLLEFDRQIYGETIELEFAARLRDEMKFPSLPALIHQIGEDVSRTDDILK
jgi:riboflavin kinase/FMN adenylyltransferase